MFAVIAVFRDNDQDVISLDDVTCQRILCAAEVLNYSEPAPPPPAPPGAAPPPSMESFELSSGTALSSADSELAQLAEPESVGFSGGESGATTPAAAPAARGAARREAVTYRGAPAHAGSTSCMVELDEGGAGDGGDGGGAAVTQRRHLERMPSSQSFW